MKNKIKSVIFDMDGVLIDAKDWHYEALNRALGIFGMSISRYDHLVTYDGLPTKKKLEMLTIERGLPRGLHGFLNDLKQLYTLEIISTTCKPIFKQQYALSKLNHMGYKLAVCSNSVSNSIETMMRKSGLFEYLEFFLSNEDVKLSKPNPEMYTTAIKRLGFRPDECLIVEDNEYGVKAALASGAHLFQVYSVGDVNLTNIMNRINEIEGMKNA